MSKKRHLIYCFVAFVAGFATIVSGKAQENDQNELEISTGFHLTSRYLWRGLLLSPGASAQPFMEITGKGFIAGAWGSSTLHPYEWQEVDLYLSYEWKNLRLSVFDYFYFNDTLQNPGYFNYKNNETTHVLELVAEFTGSDKIPFRVLGGYNFYGADPTNSMYFELAWMKSLGNTELEIFSGYTPHKGFYHESKRGFTNVGVSAARNIYISDQISIPFQVRFVYNPLAQKTIMVATIGIR
jgi:hypothetical protein